MTISSKITNDLAESVTAHFSRVPGYLSRGSAEMVLLFDAIQVDQGVKGDILEVGVFKGRGSLFFAHLLRAGETLHVSDLFDRQDLNVSHSVGPGFEAWQENFKRFKIGEPLVKLHHGPSKDLAAERLGRGFRLAYLDGGHATDEVVSDLVLAEEILLPGGIAVVDDTFFEEFPGTTEGVIRYLDRPGSKLAPFLCFDNKVALIDRDRADGFRAELMTLCDQEEHLRFPDQQFAGTTVAIVGFLGAWELRSKRLKDRYPRLHSVAGTVPALRKAFDRVRGATGRT